MRVFHEQSDRHMNYWINTVLMRVPAGLFSRACASSNQPIFPWRSLTEIPSSMVAIDFRIHFIPSNFKIAAWSNDSDACTHGPSRQDLLAWLQTIEKVLKSGTFSASPQRRISADWETRKGITSTHFSYVAMHFANADHRVLIGPCLGVFVLARVGKLTEKSIAYYLFIFLETYPPSFFVTSVVVNCPLSSCPRLKLLPITR